MVPMVDSAEQARAIVDAVRYACPADHESRLIGGTFRFHEEFGLAVELINRRRVDLKPLLTGVYQLDEAQTAFEIAADRSRSMKVQLTF